MERHNEGYLLFSKKNNILGTHSVKDVIFYPFQQNHCSHLYISKGGNRSSTNTCNIKKAFHISFQMSEVFGLANIL